MVTKTVAGDGTGDYNCDGTNDEVEINYALAWAQANPQSTIYIKGPFSYDIRDSLLVGSYTTIKMDSTTKLRLTDSASWAVNKPLIGQLEPSSAANIEIYGGEIDGNYIGNSGTLINEPFETMTGWTLSNATAIVESGNAKITATGINYNISKTVAYDLSTSVALHINLRCSNDTTVYVKISSDDGVNWNKYLFDVTSVGTQISQAIGSPIEQSGTIDLTNVTKIEIGNTSGIVGEILYVDFISFGAGTYLTLNTGYYPFMVFSDVENVNVHDMNLHDGAGHGLHITRGKNILFHDNIVKRLGGDALFCDATTTVDNYSNHITVRGNSGIHIKNTANTLTHNNFLIGIDDLTGGIAAILIEDTDGTTTYPYIYDNVILDAYGCGILIQETGTGNRNKHKHCHCHHNTVRGAGTTTIYDFNSGCTVQGFNGAKIEYNSFDSCYNSGFLVRYASLDDGNVIEFSNNTITNTKPHRNERYRHGWSGRGISNNYPTKYSVTLFNNIVYNNEIGNYFGVDGSNDVPVSQALQKYIPPTSYIQDEVPNYYVSENGIPRTAYINRYPFRWQAKKIDMAKSIGQEKPPGIDGWCLEDFGFGGANITLACYAYSLEEMRQVIAAFYQPGKAILELGGIYQGWRITGITANHSTDITLTRDVPERAYPFEILFLADKAIMESTTKKIRTKKITDDQQEWAADDCYPGNCVKNHNFHTWTQGNIAMSWDSQTSAADNNWTSLCWCPAASGTTNITVGTEPYGIAINPAGTKAYVSCCYNDRVSVITLADNTVATISSGMGYTPAGIGVHPDGSKVYVACMDSNNVKVITASNNTVSATISTNIGTNPAGLAVSPDGSKVIVTNYGGSDVSVITTSNNTAVKISNIGANPRWAAYTPDGSKIYVTVEGTGNVKVITASNNTITNTITVGSQPHGIAILPNGTKAYVANNGGDSVSVIDLSNDTVIKTIPVGDGPVGVTASSDSSKVYVCNCDGTTISVISTETDSVSSTISGLTTPGMCALTSTKLYVTRFNSSSTTVTQYLLSATGKFVAVANSGTGNRVMSSLDGITWTSQTSATDNNWTSVCYSSALTLFCAVANSGTGNRVMTSPDGVTWTSRTSAADNDWRCVCAGTGTNKFVAVGGSGTYRVMYSTNGTSWSTASAALALVWSSVCWSAAKTLFVAVAYTGTTQQVMTSTSGSSWTARNTPISQAWTSVCYSPDLGMFAAVSENGSNQQVMTSTDGTNWTAQMTPLTAAWQSICWNPDEDCFVAVANTGTGKRVMTSANGIKWVLQDSAADLAWSSVCYSSDLSTFAAVASSGTGNRVMTSSDCHYDTLNDTAPTDWIFREKGQRQSDHSYRGLNSYMVRGDHHSKRRGYSAQPLKLESGLQYVLSATAKVQGRTQGRFHVGIYSGESKLYGLDWDEDTDWDTHEEYCTFDEAETDLELRMYSDDYANDEAYMYCDQVFIVRAKHYDSSELGNDIVTTGTVDVIPDVMITATRLTEGAITEGFNIKTIDPSSGTYEVDGVTYTLLRTEVLPAKANKRHRIDKVSCRKCSDDWSYDAYTRVTYQCASRNGGAETDLWEFRSNRQYPDFEDKHHSPFLMCGENESCTLRWYGRSERSDHKSYHKDFSCDHTEIITNKLGTGIQIYNTADPLTVMHVCNKLDPGSTMEINADGTGSFRYLENLADITYQTVCHSRTGDSYDPAAQLLTLATTGSVVYRFDTRYPITGIPFMVMDVIAGNPQIAIAAEDSGNPGTYYAIDQNLTTDQSGQTIYRELVQEANYSLKGSTVFYVRITPYTGQTCVISSLFLYADLITLDAERPKILATGQPNTFKVNMPNNTALEVSLQYRDAHRMI